MVKINDTIFFYVLKNNSTDFIISGKKAALDFYSILSHTLIHTIHLSFSAEDYVSYRKACACS